MADWLALSRVSFTPESNQEEIDREIPNQREIIWTQKSPS